MRRILIGSILVALIAAAAAGAWYWRTRRPAPAPQASQGPPALPPGAEIVLQATLRARHVVPVNAPVDGILEEFPVKPGDEVFEGQILGRIQNDLLEQEQQEAVRQLESAKFKLNGLESALIAARLEESRAAADATRARTDRQAAEKSFTRQQMLHREGATPRKAFEAASAAFEASRAEEKALDALADALRERVAQSTRDVDGARQAVAEKEAELEQAQTDLTAAQLTSPVDGLIIAIKKSAGAEVMKDEAGIIEIAVDLTLLEAVAEPEPPLLSRIKPGQPAVIVLAELSGDGLAAQVRAVEEGKVYVEFASPTTLIRPGASASVRLRLN